MKIKNQKLKIKKFLSIFILTFLFFSLMPNLAQAGLVPCGGCAKFDPVTKACIERQPTCNLCHVFELLNNIFVFLLIPNKEINNNVPLIPTIAVLMFIIGGFYLLIAGPSPELFTKAKSILTATVIGLVICFVAFVFLNTFFMYIGVAEWTGLTIVATGKIEIAKGDGVGLNSLTDVSKDKPFGDFKNFPIMIRKGPGVTQTRIVDSNDANTIYITENWNPPLGDGSEYSIGGRWFTVVCK